MSDAHLHLDGGCDHQGSNVCPTCADLTHAEVAAIRTHQALLNAKHAADAIPEPRRSEHERRFDAAREQAHRHSEYQRPG